MHRISAFRGIIAVDFGNTLTKLVVQAGESPPTIVNIPGLSRPIPCCPDSGNIIPVIPSVIRFSHDMQARRGIDALDSMMNGRGDLVQWMVHYIVVGSPARVLAGDSYIRFQEAAVAFLEDVLLKVCEQYHITCPELVMAVPSRAYDNFQRWASGFASKHNYTRIRLIDDAAAAAHLCCPGLEPGEPFLFFDFGGDTLEVCIASLANDKAPDRCRVIGHVIEQVGGVQINHWLYDEVLKRAHGNWWHEPPADLLQQCERVKEILSTADQAVIKYPGNYSIVVTRKDFENILDEHGLYARIRSAIERALAGALSRGYPEMSIAAVIAAGGCSAIPSVKSLLIGRFGADKVRADSPLDVIVRGSASAEMERPGEIRIRNHYAIRVWNPGKAAFTLHTLVRRGTPFPSDGPVARIRIQGTYDGQAQLGLPVYEIQQQSYPGDVTRSRELVIQFPEAIRCEDAPRESGEDAGTVWVNQKSPTFIPADPPALQGEPRFEVWFMIDATRKLLVSARDIRTGKMAIENVIVTELS